MIVGDGAERKALEKEVENLNIDSSVEFLGRVPHEEMVNLLSKADIYVSTSHYDGTSVSLLEAMGSGAFPIVTDIPANREWIINGENGFLVPENKEKFLAKRIIDVIRNRELLERSLKRNRFMVEQKAHWPVYIRKIKKIYGNISNS
jgi:glycosyltransferase involved in cell wall biosynthesis